MSERDELQARMRGLSRGAERTAAPGLADVRHRRARRQRNTVLGTSLAVVGVLSAGFLVLSPLGADERIQPIGPGPTASAPTSTSSAPTSPTPTSATSTSSAATSAPTDPPEAFFTLDLGSLPVPDDLTNAGISLQSAQGGDADGQPTLPPLCTASSWQEQHSDPVDRVSASYVSDGASLVYDLLAYDDEVVANAALVKLKDDARACPVVNEFLEVTVAAVGVAVGEEFVDFALDVESGEDGSVERIWVTVARVGNVLVAATVDRDPGFDGDVSGDQDLSRTVAQVGVDHLLAG